METVNWIPNRQTLKITLCFTCVKPHEPILEAYLEPWSCTAVHRDCNLDPDEQRNVRYRGVLTDSSGGRLILAHSTEGPLTCRNLWKRFLKPSKSFLET